jgi:NAD+ kinase
MKIGIYTNLNRDPDGASTKNLFTLLQKRVDCEVFLSEELMQLNLNATYLSRESLAKLSDIVVVMGGDGTILRIARECALHNALIYAINLGSKGFLSESENNGLQSQVDFLLSKKYAIDERRLLEVKSRKETFFALNEVVLARGEKVKAIKCEIRQNDELMDRYVADGVIISTPTGTTAYNLSAGGPIVAPDVRALIVTPISAHSLHSKPVVVSDKNIINISLLTVDTCAHLSIDGEDVMHLVEGDSFCVKTSNLVARFIRQSNYSFFERLLYKFRKWSEF